MTFIRNFSYVFLIFRINKIIYFIVSFMMQIFSFSSPFVSAAVQQGFASVRRVGIGFLNYNGRLRHAVVEHRVVKS